MSSFFDKNNPATKFLTALCNLILANLLFIITSLPVVTIGASITSLYRVTFKIFNGDEVGVWRDFFDSFKGNFKKATIIWIPYLIINAFFLFELYLVFGGLQGTEPWMNVPIIIVMAVLLCVALYVFPLLSMFENTIKETIRNAALLALGNLPTTILIAVIHIGIGYVLILQNLWSVAVFSLLVLCGFAVVAIVCTVFLNKVIPADTKIDTPVEDD